MIRYSPSRTRPATTSVGWVIGPITAPQTTSTVSRCFNFNHERTPGVYCWSVPLTFPVNSNVLKLCGFGPIPNQAHTRDSTDGYASKVGS